MLWDPATIRPLGCPAFRHIEHGLKRTAFHEDDDDDDDDSDDGDRSNRELSRDGGGWRQRTSVLCTSLYARRRKTKCLRSIKTDIFITYLSSFEYSYNI